MASRNPKNFDKEQMRPNQGPTYNSNRRGGRGRGGAPRRRSYEQRSRDDTGNAPLRENIEQEVKVAPPPSPRESFTLDLKSFPAMEGSTPRRRTPSKTSSSPLRYPLIVGESGEPLELPTINEEKNQAWTPGRKLPSLPTFIPLSKADRSISQEHDLVGWVGIYSPLIKELYEKFEPDKENVSIKDFYEFMYHTSEDRTVRGGKTKVVS